MTDAIILKTNKRIHTPIVGTPLFGSATSIDDLDFPVYTYTDGHIFSDVEGTIPAVFPAEIFLPLDFGAMPTVRRINSRGMTGQDITIPTGIVFFPTAAITHYNSEGVAYKYEVTAWTPISGFTNTTNTWINELHLNNNIVTFFSVQSGSFNGGWYYNTSKRIFELNINNGRNTIITVEPDGLSFENTANFMTDVKDRRDYDLSTNNSPYRPLFVVSLDKTNKRNIFNLGGKELLNVNYSQHYNFTRNLSNNLPPHTNPLFNFINPIRIFGFATKILSTNEIKILNNYNRERNSIIPINGDVYE